MDKRKSSLGFIAVSAIVGCSLAQVPVLSAATTYTFTALPDTIGGLYSDAYSVNGSGTVVGVAYNASGEAQAFIYTRAGGMTDLGTPLGALSSGAYSVNGSGEVVGDLEISAM